MSMKVPYCNFEVCICNDWLTDVQLIMHRISGCLMQLASSTMQSKPHNHCLLSLTATRVTTQWSICLCSVQMSSKIATVQYKPVTSLAGSNNALTHYKLTWLWSILSHPLSNIYGLYGCSCNLLNIISVYSLNLGKLPGHFSYEWPGCDAMCACD